MRNHKKIILILSILFVVGSCKKEISAPPQQQQKRLDPSKIFKTPSTSEEKLLVENLGKLTGVLKELYKDQSNLKLVNAAIYSKAFKDESVLVRDLIYPEESWLTKVNRFKTLSQKWNVSLTAFAGNFWREVKKKNDPAFDEFLNKLAGSEALRKSNNKMQTLEGDGVSIYYPYSDEFLPVDDGGGGYYAPITSVVTATADADEGWGDLPYYLNGVFQYYTQVLVNDDYAFEHPTQIVGVNGIEADLDANGTTDNPPPPPPPPGVSRVYIGEGVCKKQYDHLISFTGNGGGSEIKYCHLSGYLQPVNGQVTTFQDIASVDFSRSQIRKQTWLRKFIVWDDDWVPNDLEQVLGIYEEDNTNSRTFSGSLTTTVKPDSSAVSATGTIGFSITIQSQDDIIRQLKISRNSYFAGAFQNQGWSFSPDATFLPLPYTHGWPAYDVDYFNKSGANVGWTWPYNTF